MGLARKEARKKVLGQIGKGLFKYVKNTLKFTPIAPIVTVGEVISENIKDIKGGEGNIHWRSLITYGIGAVCVMVAMYMFLRGKISIDVLEQIINLFW